MVKQYVPDQGDVVYVDFNPTKSHEQNGMRPAVVLSPKTYNAKSELCLVCPVTSTQKGYPFEVLLSTKKVQGVILSDQIRSVSWVERSVRKVAVLEKDALEEVLEKVKILL